MASPRSSPGFNRHMPALSNIKFLKPIALFLLLSSIIIVHVGNANPLSITPLWTKIKAQPLSDLYFKGNLTFYFSFSYENSFFQLPYWMNFQIIHKTFIIWVFDKNKENVFCGNIKCCSNSVSLVAVFISYKTKP